MGNKPNAYLCGKMGGLTLEQMNGWRIEATKLLEENFNVINPCNFYSFQLDPSTYTDREVKEFDLVACKNSKILLFNLDFPDTIGSAIEAHMSHDEWDIPVVAFGGKDVWVHPWILSSITKRCETIEDAVNHINKFYLPIF